MPSLVERVNKPIFIVSSGRSGSTILTWCLAAPEHHLAGRIRLAGGPLRSTQLPAINLGLHADNAVSSAQISSSAKISAGCANFFPKQSSFTLLETLQTSRAHYLILSHSR